MDVSALAAALPWLGETSLKSYMGTAEGFPSASTYVSDGISNPICSSIRMFLTIFLYCSSAAAEFASPAAAACIKEFGTVITGKPENRSNIIASCSSRRLRNHHGRYDPRRME